jgi:hypothetical protein
MNIKKTLLAAGTLLMLAVPAWAFDPISLCNAGRPFEQVVASYGNGTMAADANGCLTFDEDKDFGGRDLSSLEGKGYNPTNWKIPWGLTPVNQATATPACAFVGPATSLACIIRMTGNVTGMTLSGMTPGAFYSVIWLQDPVGAHTVTQAAVAGAPPLAASELAVNGYAVWIVQASSAVAATFMKDYPNRWLGDVFQVQQVTVPAAIGGGSPQVQPTTVIPGLATGHAFSCNTQAAVDPVTWASILLNNQLVAVNAGQCVLTNTSTGAVTPSASTINIRLLY